MSVLMRHELPGVTAEQAGPLITPMIDQLKAFPGFVSQASGPIPGGFQVTEVWESQEAHERWVREHVVPTMQQAGMLPPGAQLPPSQYLPIDRFFTR